MSKGFDVSGPCAKCGGRCCQRYPGTVYPGDLRPRREQKLEDVKAMLADGLYIVDHEVTDLNFLRPNHIQNWPKTCVFLRADGCSLSFEDRPRGCRMLEPYPKGEGGESFCDEHGHTRMHGAQAWSQYQGQLKRAEREVSA